MNGTPPLASGNARVADARLRIWDRLRLRYGTKDLLPHRSLEHVGGDTWSALANGAEFQLRHPVAPGWYMAEMEVQWAQGRTHATFHVDQHATGHEDEPLRFGLPLQGGRLAKRLLYIPTAAQVRFEPVSTPGTFKLAHFRLVRMTAGAAQVRILRKLQKLHPRYQSAHDLIPSSDLATLSLDYDSLFRPTPTGGTGYLQWIKEVETLQIPSETEQLRRMRGWNWQPTFSILLPTFNTPEPFLRACLESVYAQSYPKWELCIADDASNLAHVANVLKEFAARDKRVKLTFRNRNGHISEASNTALGMANGDFIVLLDHDDTLAHHSLFAVAERLQQRESTQIVYSDEDKLDQNGKRCDPFFKPDWSPDLFYSQNYVSHLSVCRRDLVNAVGGFRAGYEGSQDYDLLLRCIARVDDTRDILHVPSVLYHWRMTETSTSTGHHRKDYATPAAHRALQEHMNEVHPGALVETRMPGVYRVNWQIPSPQPLVSLIIPTRDGYELLKSCVESIIEKTTYGAYEILLVDNQSKCNRTLEYMHSLARSDTLPPVHVLRYDKPFNYSAINNYAAERANGEIVGLINNDVTVINPEWLTELVSHAVRPDVGCVGAKLYYPDGTLQHAGVVLGIGGVAGHSHKYFPGSSLGYFSRLITAHNVSAVTGAALLMRKELFQAVGGLDELGLQVAFNDVDLCIKVRERGLRNVWTPFAELYHHESKTRGSDSTPEKRVRFEKERDLMIRRWGDLLNSDPYYNPNLSLMVEDYSLTTASRFHR